MPNALLVRFNAVKPPVTLKVLHQECDLDCNPLPLTLSFIVATRSKPTPAKRQYSFYGDDTAIQELRGLAQHAGKLLLTRGGGKLARLVESCKRRWRPPTPERLWWTVLCEAAWRGDSGLLPVERFRWWKPGRTLEMLPYDYDAARQVEDRRRVCGLCDLPPEVMRKTPPTFISEIRDAALLSAELLALLTAEPGGGQTATEAAATHSPDYTSVNWFGTQYTFAKGNQAESVRVLWEAWESGGHSLSQETIGERIDSEANPFELAKVFRRRRNGHYEPHPAWGTMIRPAGKGIYRLAPPESL